ncbi:MAG: RNA 3'-terminal phosphate cyclase [Haloarculaceae archaeon]
MLELDGSAAGGQFLRSALSLAALTGTPIAVEGVRGSRPESGLRPQHLAAVEAVAAVCDAAVTGAHRGSETVTVEPGAPTGGEVSADLETAGSVALLFDALLPLALVVDRPLTVRATGGTDVKWAPPLAATRLVTLPLLRELGALAAVDVERRGFYPVGGGRVTLRVAPAEPEPVELSARGDPTGVRVVSIATTDLADAEVAERQADAAVAALPEDRPIRERRLAYVDADSPGTVCAVRADYGRGVAGFDALGEKGKPAEEVGLEAAEPIYSFEGTAGAVDRHLADQLLVLLGICGGELAIPAVTAHVETSLALLDAFDVPVSLSERDAGALLTAPGIDRDRLVGD